MDAMLATLLNEFEEIHANFRRLRLDDALPPRNAPAERAPREPPRNAQAPRAAREAERNARAAPRVPQIGDRVRFAIRGAGRREGMILRITDHRLRIGLPGMCQTYLRAPHNVTLL